MAAREYFGVDTSTGLALVENVGAGTLTADASAFQNGTDVAKGAALVTDKLEDTGAKARTLHFWIKKSVRYQDQFDDASGAAAQINAMILALYALGGGTGYLTYDDQALTLAAAGIVHKPGVWINGRGARLTMTLAAASEAYAWRGCSNARIEQVELYSITNGSLGSQAIFGPPLTLGAPNTNGDTVASPNPFSIITGFEAEGVILHNDRQFGPALQIVGDVSYCNFRQLLAVTSATQSAYHADWGDQGGVAAGFSTSPSGLAAGKTAFLAGTFQTTHPRHLLFERCDAGSLTVTPSGDLGANLFRFSGCNDITVKGARATTVSYAVLNHTLGDPGYEFAPDWLKRRAAQNNVFEGLELEQAASTMDAALRIDTRGDNVDDAQYTSGYVALMDPFARGKVRVTRSTLMGANAASKYGARIKDASGVEIDHCTFKRWDINLWVDENTDNIKIHHNEISEARTHGIQLGFDNVRKDTKNVKINDNDIFGNGTAATGYGINVVRVDGLQTSGNNYGKPGESTQVCAVRLAEGFGPRNVQILDDVEIESTIAAFLLGDGSLAAPWYHRSLSLFRATCGLATPALQGGHGLIPIASTLRGDIPSKVWANITTDSHYADDPNAGSHYEGDEYVLGISSSGHIPRKRCVKSGTFGTLSGLTNCVTVNGNSTVTMSLASKTATTVAGDFSITVNSATNLRIGIKVTVTAAGISNATILSISGTTIGLDARAKSTQTAVTLTTAGVLEGEVVHIDTTSAIVAAIVKKVNADSVLLSKTPANSQSSRTVTYETPTFENFAVTS